MTDPEHKELMAYRGLLRLLWDLSRGYQDPLTIKHMHEAIENVYVKQKGWDDAAEMTAPDYFVRMEKKLLIESSKREFERLVSELQQQPVAEPPSPDALWSKYEVDGD